MLDLQDIFGPTGPLQQALANFKIRRQQLRMAERVAQAIEGRELLAVEAGTGTGKTFAYLVPALLSGVRVLISTGTRTLQDQLFSKDLPLVAAALGRPARVAILKGRSNYLCRYRLARVETIGEQLTLDTDPVQSSSTPHRMLARILNWSRTTRVGDLAELRGLSDSHPVWPRVTSTRENCLGVRCPEISRCHVAIARRKALDADVVIVNHHLLLADLALKEDGFGDILGSSDAVILDEAHQIPDLATQFFGATVSSRRVESLLREVHTEVLASVQLRSDGSQPAVEELLTLARAAEDSLRSVSAALPTRLGRVNWTDSDTPLQRGLEELSSSLQHLQARLELFEPDSAAASVGSRMAELTTSLDRIAGVDTLEGARAAEVTQRGFVLSLMPFDISARFQSLVQSRRCAWIFTSATLSLGEDFTHFTARLGLSEAPTLKIDSPFDYERQSLLYLPTGMPEPAASGFDAAVMRTALTLIDASRGGAFVLFTSHRSLARGAEFLRQHWFGNAPYRLYVQGEAPRERLLQDFREDGNGVLLGTASFWEGVDVKGDALRLVIIEKLPFASPDDPLVRARIEHLQAIGGNPFREYQLPEAALALKQGVGRLIRSEEDFGVVAICDSRITGRGYGRTIVAALPPMGVTRDCEEAVRFLRRRAQGSTAGAAPHSVPT